MEEKKDYKGLIIVIMVFAIIIGSTNIVLVLAKGVDYFIAYKTAQSVSDGYVVNPEEYSIECQQGQLKDGVLSVEIRFTNNSEKTVSFDSVFTAEAYQDGIQLNEEIAVDNNSSLKVKPDKTITIAKQYIVNSKTEPVSLEITAEGSDEAFYIIELK